MRVAEFSGAHHIPSGIVSHIFGAPRPASTQGEPAEVADPPHPARKFAVGCSERDNLPLNVRDYTYRGGGAASTPRGASVAHTSQESPTNQNCYPPELPS